MLHSTPLHTTPTIGGQSVSGEEDESREGASGGRLGAVGCGLWLWCCGSLSDSSTVDDGLDYWTLMNYWTVMDGWTKG